jgi:hypothetical protein
VFKNVNISENYPECSIIAPLERESKTISSGRFVLSEKAPPFGLVKLSSFSNIKRIKCKAEVVPVLN